MITDLSRRATTLTTLSLLRRHSPDRSSRRLGASNGVVGEGGGSGIPILVAQRTRMAILPIYPLDFGDGRVIHRNPLDFGDAKSGLW
jgi:hypothetical protein